MSGNIQSEDIPAGVSNDGLLLEIKRSKEFFSPLTEAITNSLEAIKEANVEPSIEIDFYYKPNLPLDGSTTKDFIELKIIDNGVGFNEESFQRFIDIYTKNKGYSNNGTGRIQILHSFEEIYYESIYKVDSKFFKRKFFFNRLNYIHNHTNIKIDNARVGTTLTLSRPIGKEFVSYLENLTIANVRSEIAKKFLVLLNTIVKAFNIAVNFYENNIRVANIVIRNDNFYSPEKEDDIKVNVERITVDKKGDVSFVKSTEEILKIVRFKISSDILPSNTVSLYRKGVFIENFSTPIIKSKENIDGYRYLSAIYGDLLNNNVSNSGDSFNFPQKKDIARKYKEEFNLADEDATYIFWDTLRDSIREKLTDFYEDITAIRDEKLVRVDDIAKRFAISPSVANKIKADIDPDDNNNTITQKLFAEEGRGLAKKNIKVIKAYDKLVKLDPSSEDYARKLQGISTNILKLIPEQNKLELGRYVIRRHMVTKVLSLILDNKLLAQNEEVLKKKGRKRKDPEGILHDLFFKRGEIGDGSELWLLNEEFVHFNSFSNIPLKDIKYKNEKIFNESFDEAKAFSEFKLESYNKRKPDILMFPEEGQCVIIEFKAPGIQTFDLNQIARYATLISLYTNQRFNQFYGYYICQDISEIDLIGFKRSHDKTYFFNPSIPLEFDEKKLGNLYQEVIKFSSLASRAERRNRNFVEKLGLDDILDATETPIESATNYSDIFEEDE